MKVTFNRNWLGRPRWWASAKVSAAALVFKSLFYNDHLSWSYALDTLLGPAFWCVDAFAGALGPLFVAGVVGLTSSVVAIAYAVGLPYYWTNKGPAVTLTLVAVGQFFFVNVVYHYWKALTIHPGRVKLEGPDENQVAMKQVTSICKKCVAPKPPRAHHCSVCNTCVLKMDHHCPWINGCIGHFNHRHFFLYMTYTVLGCLFLMTLGFEILWYEVFPEDEVSDPDPDVAAVEGPFSRRSLVFYEAAITSGCFFVLGGLTLWHANLITRGETSIEAHINRAEAKKDPAYRNPYDFSPWHNWCLFLGMTRGRGWSHVLLPSGHLPEGDGLEWDTVYSCNVRWNDDNGGSAGHEVSPDVKAAAPLVCNQL